MNSRGLSHGATSAWYASVVTCDNESPTLAEKSWARRYATRFCCGSAMPLALAEPRQPDLTSEPDWLLLGRSRQT